MKAITSVPVALDPGRTDAVEFQRIEAKTAGDCVFSIRFTSGAP